MVLSAVEMLKNYELFAVELLKNMVLSAVETQKTVHWPLAVVLCSLFTVNCKL